MDVIAWEKIHLLKVGRRMVTFYRAAGSYAWVVDSGLSTGHPDIQSAVGSALQWLRRQKHAGYPPPPPFEKIIPPVTMLPYDVGTTITTVSERADAQPARERKTPVAQLSRFIAGPDDIAPKPARAWKGR